MQSRTPIRLFGGACLAAFTIASGLNAQRDASRPTPKDIAPDAGHQIPKVHYVPADAARTKYPVWVDASMVFTKDGGINREYFWRGGIEEVEALLKAPLEHGCVQAGAIYDDIVGLPPRDSLEQASKNSQLVLLGKVTEIAVGFGYQTPGQLLRVSPQEVIKGKPRNVPAYFVFVPVGDFTLDGKRICKTDERFPDPPHVGDRVLLLVPNGPNWQQKQDEPFLDLQDDSGLVTLRSDSTASLPARFRRARPELSAEKTEDILARVRAASGKEDN